MYPCQPGPPFHQQQPGMPGGTGRLRSMEHHRDAAAHLAVRNHPGGAPAEEKTCESTGSGEPSGARSGARPRPALPTQRGLPAGLPGRADLAPLPRVLHALPVETRFFWLYFVKSEQLLHSQNISTIAQYFYYCPLVAAAPRRATDDGVKGSLAHFCLVMKSISMVPAFCSGNQKQFL